jgi:3',5'-cyclic-nucleotide phosphodiesterase
MKVLMSLNLIRTISTIVILFFVSINCISEDTNRPKFKAIVLGSAGGLSEDNLTSFLLSPINENNFIALDAGTLNSGIKKAAERGSFSAIEVPEDSALSIEGWILQNHIKAYLITHAHLDHISGLIINSPADSNKKIFGILQTIENLRDHIFNWKIWPNFGSAGQGLNLKKYDYVQLESLKETQIEQTSMSVIPFVLSHGNDHYPSTAFLINSNGYYVLYFGDTGPDIVEKADNMKNVWAYIAPLIKEKKLRAIFLESSFPSSRLDNMLYGHLTPKWMIHELSSLTSIVNKENPKSSLKDLPVVVTHIKPSIKKDRNTKEIIRKELEELNSFGIKFIIPNQGDRLEF